MSVVAMEPPVIASGGDGNSFRDEKVKVLKCTEALKLEDTVVRFRHLSRAIVWGGTS